MNGLRGCLLIVRRSLALHRLSSAVTVLSTALASGLVMAVFVVSAQSYRAFAGGPVGFDAVLGARGSQLQLVLNTVFHLETSPGNIPYELYAELEQDPRIALAVPYAVGDNYRGFRIVGTSTEIFTDFEYEEGRRFTPQAGGRAFDPVYREAVLGATVAQRTGLAVGDTLQPYHGLSTAESSKHEQVYTVVGVLEPTNTPSDRVIWIPIEGVWRMDGHQLRGTGEAFIPEAGSQIPDEHKEVSAVMLTFKSPQAGFMLNQTINRQGQVATLAWPIGTVMADLFDKLGWVVRVLELVAYLVVVVAAGSILASLYNTMNERRREFAILRALGARRSTVFGAIVLESSTIALLGSLLGFAIYAAILGVAAWVVRARTGVVLDAFSFHPVFLLAPAGMLAAGALAGLLPAFRAYSTDVADGLSSS